MTNETPNSSTFIYTNVVLTANEVKQMVKDELANIYGPQVAGALNSPGGTIAEQINEALKREGLTTWQPTVIISYGNTINIYYVGIGVYDNGIAVDIKYQIDAELEDFEMDLIEKDIYQYFEINHPDIIENFTNIKIIRG